MSTIDREGLAPDAWLLPEFAADTAPLLLAEIAAITSTAPFRRMSTPGGLPMSVAMTNCGDLGWVSDRRGYRYEPRDPMSGKPWSPMPQSFRSLGEQAAQAAGFAGFVPDACLINRYEPGARMSLHRDQDECDFDWPIVSVSLGLPAIFLLGGHTRAQKQRRISLCHGDVVVWGGDARLRYHGVLPVQAGDPAAAGPQRFNLTLRRAGT